MIAGVLNSQTSAKHSPFETQDGSTAEWFHLSSINLQFFLPGRLWKLCLGLPPQCSVPVLTHPYIDSGLTIKRRWTLAASWQSPNMWTHNNLPICQFQIMNFNTNLRCSYGKVNAEHAIGWTVRQNIRQKLSENKPWGKPSVGYDNICFSLKENSWEPLFLSGQFL